MNNKITAAELPSFFANVREAWEKSGSKELPFFVCIGTDRSTGDALGPLIGTELAEWGWPQVIGTLSEPCDANLVSKRLSGLHADAFVIAVDACLGRAPESVGLYIVKEGPLAPAESVGLKLPPVGRFSVAGIVNAAGAKPYSSLQTTSLNRVMIMGKEISTAIRLVFEPISS